EADGTTDKQGRTSLIIKERRLATFAHILGLRFSVITSLKKVRISGNTYYKLLFIRKNVARIYKDKLLVKILRKEELSRHHPRGIDPRSRVYNLQVEGDESYCTTLAALHNCQIHKKGEKLWLFTRRLENVTAAFPDVVEMCRRAIKARECIIEGEALAIDPKTHRPMPFQMLSTRIKRKYGIEKARKEMPVQVNLFDIVYLDGRSLFQEPLKERDRALKSVVKPIPGKFQFAEKLITKDLKKAEAFYKKSLAAGQEGLMVKNLDARYQPGRRVAGGWLKVKPVMESLDLAIIGATWGTGKRAGWLGSLILGCRDPESGKFLECGMLGTGIKEKKTKPEDVTFLDMTNMLKPHIEQEKGGTVKIKPKVVIEVAYEEIQKSPTYASGWALRFPRFIRLRLDKSPAEADTRERIKSLYKIQKGKK
ncbi:MAG: ATP-dependent DNA ligase, partial [Candidatus Aenigmatarchaeota archaeon]